MSERVLKPCPFCGGKAVFDTNGNMYWAICLSCGARSSGTFFSGKKGRKIIVDRWNRREVTE